MKRLTLLSTLLLSAVSLFAQDLTSRYECIYKYNVSSHDKNGKPFEDTGYCILQIGNGIGKFYDYSSYQTDSVRQAKCSDQEINSYRVREHRNLGFFDQTVYQNLPKGKMTVQSTITPNLYSYEEKRYPVQWTVTESEDTVCGYSCRVAHGEYGGRKWTVKFAPEIPVQNGPWKLTGLPGLILDAQDSEGIHHFTAIAFRNGSVNISPLMTSGMISTSREKFVQAKNKFEENPIGNLPPELIGEMEVRKHSDNPADATILINGMQLRMRPNPYVPLEKE